MQIFELNEAALRKGWGGSGRYWFSLKDYIIRDIADIADMEHSGEFSQSAYFVSIGLIPYFVVTSEEVIRSYINSIDNKKLKSVFSKIDDSDYVEDFWKYFNVYPELSDGYNDFENNYLLQKAELWCQENAIKYIVK